MILQPGITSFYSLGEWIPQFGLTEFKRIVFGVATSLSYIVADVTESGVVPNFHSALLSKNDESILVVGNSIFPVFAFADPSKSGYLHLEFIDAKALAQRFSELFPDVTVGSTSELNRKLNDEDLKELGPADLSQFDHWEPKTVGDVVFNWWD